MVIDTNKYIPPFRLGKKQKLDAKGIEVVKGAEKLAQEFVDFLNLKYADE